MSTKAPQDLIRELERINEDMKRISKMTNATRDMLVSTVSTLAEIKRRVKSVRKDGVSPFEKEEVLEEINSLISTCIKEVEKGTDTLEENLIKRF